MAQTSLGHTTAPCSQLYIVENLRKRAILKDYREEKRVPAEFFPPKLIFNRCVFSVSTMTVNQATDSLGPEGRKLVPSAHLICAVCGKFAVSSLPSA